MSSADAGGRPPARPSAMAPEPAPEPAPGSTSQPAGQPDEQVLLAVEGDIDTRGADRLRALLEDACAPGRRLVLDLSDVDHVSSAGLAVLVAGHRRLRDAGGDLVVQAPSAAVVRELRISGLHRILPVDPPQHADDGQSVGTTTSTRPVATS